MPRSLTLSAWPTSEPFDTWKSLWKSHLVAPGQGAPCYLLSHNQCNHKSQHCLPSEHQEWKINSSGRSIRQSSPSSQGFSYVFSTCMKLVWLLAACSCSSQPLGTRSFPLVPGTPRDAPGALKYALLLVSAGKGAPLFMSLHNRCCLRCSSYACSCLVVFPGATKLHAVSERSFPSS